MKQRIAVESGQSPAMVFDLSNARQLAGRLADEVRLRLGRHVTGIRLFGSAARGDWTGESDVDVLVLLSVVNPGDADAISSLAFHMGAVSTGILLRPLVMKQEQFDHLLSRERRLALDIQREGIDL